MALEKFTWQNGTQIEPAKVEIGGQSYNVSDAQYEGETPLSAANLNLMQDTLLGNVKDNLSDNTKIPSVKAVKDNLEWKLVGSETGTTSIDLPNSFNELYIEIGNGNVIYNFNIPSIVLSSTAKTYREGYFSSGVYGGGGYISITSSSVQIQDFMINGDNVTSTSTIIVYYR